MRWPIVLVCASIAACGIDVAGQLATGTVDAGPGVDPSLPPTATPVDDAAPPGADAGADATSLDGGAGADAGPRGSLTFKGGDHVSAGALAIPTDFTLEAWVRPAAHGGERYVIAKDRRNQGQGQFRLGFDASGHLFFMMTDSGGVDHGLYATNYELLSTTVVPTAVWSHVAVTKSGAAFALYIDGVAAKTFTASAAFAHGGPAVDFRIGARVDTNGTGANGGFDGAIDEVRVWKVARTQADIAASRAAPVASSSPAFADLVGYWRFDEGTGTSTADVVGVHNGTLVGGPKWITETPF